MMPTLLNVLRKLLLLASPPILDDDVQDESCSIAINLWAGGIYTSLDCLIPNEKVAAWDGWKNIGSPDVSQISEHCNEIRSFEVGEIVPAE